MLTTVLEILQMKAKYGWSDSSVNVLLTFMEDFLPERNHMAKNIYSAKKVLCLLGMEVQKIDACQNDYTLYRK